MSRVQLLPCAVFATLLLSVLACGRAGPQANNEGNEAFADQDYDAALQAYGRAESEAPDVAEPHYNSGNANYRQDDFDQAREDYERALLNADEGLIQSGMFNMGDAFFSAREFDKAAEAFKEVLRLNPDDLDAKHNLELALRQQQQQPDQGEDGQQGQGNQSQDNQGDEQQRDQQEPEDQPEPSQQQTDDGQQDQRRDRQQGPTQNPGLTPEQAKQLLESIGQETETLQGHLQQVLRVPGRPPDRDW